MFTRINGMEPYNPANSLLVSQQREVQKYTKNLESNNVFEKSKPELKTPDSWFQGLGIHVDTYA